jgi:hypothetical protein
MEVHNRPIYRRAAVVLVLFLLHGSLVLVFLGERPDYRGSPGVPEVPTTLFFLNSQPRFPPPPPDTPRLPHRPPKDLRQQLPPKAAIPSTATSTPTEHQGPAAAPTVDWLAEAHRAASEIAGLGEPGPAAESPSSPNAPKPWNSPLLEFTGHGLQVRIPVEIPGNIIDHCFGNMDLGHNRFADTDLAHNQTGNWELYQLKCALRKQPARSDLFDSLRQAPQPPK